MAKRPDVPLKTNGNQYLALMKVQEMLYASIERCPVIGGTLKRFDAREALKMPGIVKIVDVERIYGRYKYVGLRCS